MVILDEKLLPDLVSKEHVHAPRRNEYFHEKANFESSRKNSLDFTEEKYSAVMMNPVQEIYNKTPSLCKTIFFLKLADQFSSAMGHI